MRCTAICRCGSAPTLALIVGLLAACGGSADSSSEKATTPNVPVAESNTAAGRFPDEELVRAQEEELTAVTADTTAAETPTTVEPVDPSSDVEPSAGPDSEQAAGDTGEPSSADDDVGTNPAGEAIAGIPVGPLSPGLYATAEFEPPFLVEIGEGWLSFQSELADFVTFSPADDLDLSISFLSPRLSIALIDDEGEYIDADPAGEQLLDPVSFDYFDWIHGHSRYEAGELRTELFAGRAVPSFDATLTSGYAWQECFVDCVLLVATSDGELLAQETGYRERLYTTEVGDLSLVVSIAAPVDKFDAFVARAGQFLSTVQLAADVEQALGELPASGEREPSELPDEAQKTVAPQEATEPPLAPGPQEVDPPETPGPQEVPADTGTIEEPEQLPPAPLAS